MPMLLAPGFGPFFDSAPDTVAVRNTLVLIGDGLLDGNRRLLQYWLENVSQMLVIDPEDNPYSFPALEYISESAALLNVVQSISACHEQYFSPYAPMITLEE